jgi:preprotein translocase subunit SecF
LQLPNFYGKNYKMLLAIPLALFIVFFILIFVWPKVPMGIDFKGGTMVIIRADKPIDATELSTLLSQNFDLTELKVSSVSGPAGYGVNIQFAADTALESGKASVEAARAALETNPDNPDAALQLARDAVESVKRYLTDTTLPSEPEEAMNKAELALIEAGKNASQQMQDLIKQRFSLSESSAFQRREISPTLSASFWQTGLNVAIFAVILVTIVIFIFFRKIIPSFAVIVCGIFDVGCAVAMMAVFSIPLSLSSIPTLLMLLGYSIDTDVMLTSRMLQRKEKSPVERAYGSLNTGLTMTGTTIGALLVMLVVSYFNQISIIFEISAVLLFGLVGDIIGTWLMNAPLLLWYVERAKKKTIF